MNKYNPNNHHRKSIRLKGYNYSQAGLYFITICTQHRACLFGHITKGEMILNVAGRMVKSEWLNLKTRFPNIELHEYVVMPNHFHGILEIVVGATLMVAQQDTGAQQDDTEMDAFKSITTVEYIRGVKNLNWKPFDGKLWQRNYYEHIIRNEKSYRIISEYILNNPAKWQNDKFKNE